jgi:hypothetical protein
MPPENYYVVPNSNQRENELCDEFAHATSIKCGWVFFSYCICQAPSMLNQTF